MPHLGGPGRKWQVRGSRTPESRLRLILRAFDLKPEGVVKKLGGRDSPAAVAAPLHAFWDLPHSVASTVAHRLPEAHKAAHRLPALLSSKDPALKIDTSEGHNKTPVFRPPSAVGLCF